ncbi:MAG: glutamine-hydrolyzing GMP synthase [Erysipelotrichaceae bacterium]|nr:glutamine-hydrolyzing GMP synthase [Erysipelotrichaceae bacterium]
MDKILVIDFGGQYSQLIARRIRNQNVYAEIQNFDQVSVEETVEAGYKGIVFSGGPRSVYDDDAPRVDEKITQLDIPILGICYGHQLLVYLEHGEIDTALSESEYGKTLVSVSGSGLFKDISEESICWMSHTDQVKKLPPGFVSIARSEKCPYAGVADEKRKLYGVQFHPEVSHTEYGYQIIRNFLFEICNCRPEWKMDDFLDKAIERYKKELKDKKVILGLSGGVDSMVCAVLLDRAIGKDLICVMVDHGLFRKGEADEIEEVFKSRFDIRLERVNAKKRFLHSLEGITDPEAKRKIIGTEFIRAFEAEAAKLQDVNILAQGTIYPDVIESGKGSSAKIKSHHNVGGLPDEVVFAQIIEPLRDLFKDEVRELGKRLGLPDHLVYRQPFPGPGLGVRIIGEVNEEKLSTLKEADAIFTEEIRKAGLDRIASQYFAVLTDSRSVGVKGDFRTYGYTVALRAVSTDDFMTAEWVKIPYEVLQETSRRITNEVKGVGRVVYDITSKPPATIEWE